VIVAFVDVISLLKQTNLASAPVFCHAWSPSYRKIFTETQTKDSFCYLLFETNRFGLGAILLPCLFSGLQEPPSLGLKLRTAFFGVLTFLKSFSGRKDLVWWELVYLFLSFK
jgi:hypothetical protein